jgi:hypothetical protein
MSGWQFMVKGKLTSATTQGAGAAAGTTTGTDAMAAAGFGRAGTNAPSWPPVSRGTFVAGLLPTAPVAQCTHPGCIRPLDDPIAARNHANYDHATWMPAAWTTATSSARCVLCHFYFPTYKEGANIGTIVTHTCSAIIPENHFGSELRGNNIFVPGIGIMAPTEAGSVIRDPNGEEHSGCCLFLAAARAAGSTVAAANNVASQYRKGTIEALRGDPALIALINIEAVTALRPHKGGPAYTSIIERVDDFEENGYADEVEVDAVAYYLRMIVFVWEILAKGYITCHVANPLGVAGKGIHVIKIGAHYKFLSNAAPSGTLVPMLPRLTRSSAQRALAMQGVPPTPVTSTPPSQTAAAAAVPRTSSTAAAAAVPLTPSTAAAAAVPLTPSIPAFVIASPLTPPSPAIIAAVAFSSPPIIVNSPRAKALSIPASDSEESSASSGAPIRAGVKRQRKQGARRTRPGKVTSITRTPGKDSGPLDKFLVTSLRQAEATATTTVEAIIGKKNNGRPKPAVPTPMAVDTSPINSQPDFSYGAGDDSQQSSCADCYGRTATIVQVKDNSSDDPSPAEGNEALSLQALLEGIDYEIDDDGDNDDANEDGHNEEYDASNITNINLSHICTCDTLHHPPNPSTSTQKVKATPAMAHTGLPTITATSAPAATTENILSPPFQLPTSLATIKSRREKFVFDKTVFFCPCPTCSREAFKSQEDARHHMTFYHRNAPHGLRQLLDAAMYRFCDKTRCGNCCNYFSITNEGRPRVHDKGNCVVPSKEADVISARERAEKTERLNRARKTDFPNTDVQQKAQMLADAALIDRLAGMPRAGPTPIERADASLKLLGTLRDCVLAIHSGDTVAINSTISSLLLAPQPPQSMASCAREKAASMRAGQLAASTDRSARHHLPTPASIDPDRPIAEAIPISREITMRAALRRSLRLLAEGRTGDAHRTIVEHANPTIVLSDVNSNKVASLYPSRFDGPPSSDTDLRGPGLFASSHVLDSTSPEAIKKITSFLESRRPDTAPGLSSLGYASFASIARMTTVLKDNALVSGAMLIGIIIDFISKGVQSGISEANLTLLRASVAMLLSKDSVGGFRPIGIGETLMQIYGYLVSTTPNFAADVKEALNKGALGLGVPGGTEACAHIIRWYAYTHQGHCILHADQKNAFHEPRREDVRNALLNHKPLLTYFDSRYGLEGTWSIFSEDFRVWNTRGVAQGDILSSHIFDIYYARLLRTVEELFPLVSIYSIHDDTYFCGPRRVCFMAASHLQKLMNPRGQSFNLLKFRILVLGDRAADTTIKIKTAARLVSENIARINGTSLEGASEATCILDDPLQQSPTDFGVMGGVDFTAYEDVHLLQQEFLGGPPFATSASGMIVGGLPVGTSAYERAFVLDVAEQIRTDIDLIIEAANSNNDFLLTDLMNMINMCVTSQLTYVMRGVCPAHSKAGLTIADGHVRRAFFTLANILERHQTDPRVLIKMALPLNLCGMGIMDAVSISFAAFSASILLTAPFIAANDSSLSDQMSQFTDGTRLEFIGYPGLGDALRKLDEALGTDTNTGNNTRHSTAIFQKFPQESQRFIQRRGSQGVRASQYLALRKELTKEAKDSQDYTNLLWWQGGGTQEGRALFGYRGRNPAYKLTNRQWQLAVQLRTGAFIESANTHCFSCARVVAPNHLHALICPFHSGQYTVRHELIAAALLREVRKNPAFLVLTEVPVDQIHKRLTHRIGGKGCIADAVIMPLTPTHDAAINAGVKEKDIPFEQRVIVEFTFTNPHRLMDKEVGSAAKTKYTYKLNKYSKDYGMSIKDGTTWVGMVAETSGFWHASSITAMKKLANAAIVIGGRRLANVMLANMRYACSAALMQSQMEIILNYEGRLALPSTFCRRCHLRATECTRLRALPGPIERCPGEEVPDATP